MEGVGGLGAGGGADVGEALGGVVGEGDESHCRREEEAAVPGCREDVPIAFRSDQKLRQDEVAGLEDAARSLCAQDHGTGLRKEQWVLLKEVNPLHGIEVDVHSPQASRSLRWIPDAPPSSGNQPFMLPSRVQNRAQPSSAVRGFSSSSGMTGGMGWDAMGVAPRGDILRRGGCSWRVNL